jgi:sulfatase modifying factor 1
MLVWSFNHKIWRFFPLLIALWLPHGESEESMCSCSKNRESTLQNVEISPLFDVIVNAVSYNYNMSSHHFGEDMLFVPGQMFRMGTVNPQIKRDGEEQRKVSVDSFYIDRYEVNNVQFQQFIQHTGYITDSERFGWSFVFKHSISTENMKNLTKAVLNAEWWVPVPNSSWLYPEGLGTNVFDTDRGNYPVVHISWNDAHTFCSWRNSSRLPTEAEWELAAGRGEDQLFPWGNKILPKEEHRANIFHGTFPSRNTNRDGYEGLAPVDAFPPQNGLGIFNMVGNAWEWVSDYWTIDHDVESILVNPKGPDSGRERTKKGGSFLCHKSFCYRYRIASRHHSTPDSATSNSGFRCAKDI